MRKCIVFIYVLISCCCCCCLSFGQSNTIIFGDLSSDIGGDISLYDVTLWQDTVLIQGKTFFDNKFCLTTEKAQQYHIKISSIQFETVDKIINTEGDSLHLGTIVVSSKKLRVINIRGKSPVFKQELDKIEMKVENSFLQDLGTLVDVFSVIPGINVSEQGSVSLIEGGKPVIYINKKKVHSVDELNALQSTDIKKVIVDMTPSSEYDAETNAVISVETKKNLQDVLSLAISNSTYFGRKFSDFSNLSINFKNGKVSNYFSFTYADDRNLQYDNTSEFVADEAQSLFSSKYREKFYGSKGVKTFYTLDYNINPKSILGFQYSGRYSNPFDESVVSQEVKELGSVENIDFVKNKDGESYLQNLSVNYNLKINSEHNLSLVTDLAFGKNINSEDISFVDLTFIQTSYKDEYWVPSFQIDYAWNKNKTLIKSGVNFSSVKNNANYTYEDLEQGNKINETIFAGYTLLEKTISGYKIKGGVRGEYIKSNVRIDKENVIDTSYVKFFPSVSISKDISKSIKTSLSYSKTISRPTFKQINPRVTYYDQISYRVGNPKLQPSFIDNFRLNLKYKKLSLSMGYKLKKNFKAQVPLRESDTEINSQIKWTYKNFDKGQYLTSSLNYNLRYKFFNSQLGFTIVKPFVKLKYLDDRYSLNEPFYILKINNEIDLNEQTLMYLLFSYKSDGDSGLFQVKSSTDLTVGISKYFFDKKLYMSLSLADVFKTKNPNNWKSEYANIQSTMKTDGDTRFLKFIVRYNFGNVKYKKISSNSESINRL